MTISHWIAPPAEAQMEAAHLPYWEAIIDRIDLPLAGKVVLDFGCSRGGFLRLLYGRNRFKHAISVDIAAAPIAVANELRGDLPIRYQATTDLTALASGVDVAFSHEVLFLLPDLARHAADIATVLVPGGVYYAVTACHTENPLWPLWREHVATSTALPPHDYRLDDYATAFAQQGFAVAAMPLLMERFVPLPIVGGQVPGVQAMLDSVTRYTVIFRFAKQ
jgi:SAM-dependent methyltransferase